MSLSDATGPTATVATLIFAATYLALALGRVPGLRLDRASIALIGAVAMIASGVIDFRDAAAAIDFETIALLFGMMVVVAYLRMGGLYTLATEAIAAQQPGPRVLLALTIGLAGVLSTVLVNDIVCVALTPLILVLCRRLGRKPIPYLIGLATASNIGSVATITGNPQNIIIGSLSGLPYLRFAARLAPIAVIGLALDYVIVAFVYRRELAESSGVAQPSCRLCSRGDRVHPGLLKRGVVVALVTVSLFFAGIPIAPVALAAAGVLMLDRLRPERVYATIDWPLLVLFAGLFVVVHVFEVRVVRGWDLGRWQNGWPSPAVPISALSVMLSNVVSNVPAVLLFRPLIAGLPQQEPAWLALAMSSTLAGNLTLLGSVANLIVVENAHRSGIDLGFVEHLKVGVPVTLLTTLVGIAWLTWTHY
jgi:Na+/H+ antiporter NhaD/arsenite permease-like protein